MEKSRNHLANLPRLLLSTPFRAVSISRSPECLKQTLNSDSRATYVTWFMQSRGIALHYCPSVPEYAASHGCVRVELEDVARLIQDNSLVDDTQVVVSGTWTKPPKQWA